MTSKQKTKRSDLFYVHTIYNRFRSERMKDVPETIFTAVLGFLVEAGYVKLEHYFIDGTKIEVNANKSANWTTGPIRKNVTPGYALLVKR